MTTLRNNRMTLPYDRRGREVSVNLHDQSAATDNRYRSSGEKEHPVVANL